MFLMSSQSTHHSHVTMTKALMLGWISSALLTFFALLPFVSGYERNTSLFRMEMYDVASKNRMIKLYFSLQLFSSTLLIFSVPLSSGNFSSSSSVRFLWLGMPGCFFGGRRSTRVFQKKDVYSPGDAKEAYECFSENKQFPYFPPLPSLSFLGL